MIRDCTLNDGTTGVEIILHVRKPFMRHLVYLAKKYGLEKYGRELSVDEYVFDVVAEKVRNNPAPTQTKEEVERIAAPLPQVEGS